MIPDDREELVRAAAAAVMARLGSGETRTFAAPVGVSGRHAHLTAGDWATLFGPQAGPTVARPLRQPGQFAAREAITVIGPGGVLASVRIVGPLRKKTVVELSANDLHKLGLPDNVPAGEPFGLALAGPQGVVRLPEAGMVSRRHLHASPQEAAAFGLADGMIVRARAGVAGRRIVLDDVLVRVAADMALELHIDRDEAAACGLRSGEDAEIIKGTGGGGGGDKPSRRGPFQRGKQILTEEGVIAAYKDGRPPAVEGILITPFARDALRKYFPGLLKE